MTDVRALLCSPSWVHMDNLTFYLDRNQSRILNLLNTDIVLLQFSRWFGGKGAKLMILKISVPVLPLSLSSKTEVKLCVNKDENETSIYCVLCPSHHLICNTGIVFVAE